MLYHPPDGMLLLLGLAVLAASFIGFGVQRSLRGVGITLFAASLFVIAWALGVAASPYAPAWWIAYWIPLLLAGLVLASVLTLVVTRRPGRPQPAIERTRSRQTATAFVVEGFAWATLFALLTVAVLIWIL